MSLKKRLIIANSSIVIIPLIVTMLAGSIFVFVYNRISGSKAGFENIEKITLIKYEIYAASERIWGEKPENLAKTEFAQYIEARLEGINAYVVVLADREVVYSGISINSVDIEKILDMKTGVLRSSRIVLDGVNHLVNLYEFQNNDGSQGNLAILTPVDGSTTAAGTFIVLVLAVFAVSFLTTNIINSSKLSRSIANPLARLRNAVGEISNGNLDYAVIEEGDDEVREVLKALEQMRLKLEESVHTQMKYDDNRKMLVSSISHDLKTPITSIKGYVEGILDGVARTPDKQEKYLRTIYTKAVQIDTMIDDLLFYSKLDLNQIPFHFEKTDVFRYLQDCEEENETEMSRNGIAMTLESNLDGIRFVMMDRERMKRVVLNILDNARKYMDKSNGVIRIILRETAGNVIIEIADNGAGIPKESLPLIFDRFYRSDSARSTAGGSGLGLAIAREIVEGHSGQIWVTSKENAGTQFMISLKKLPDEVAE
ncbi:MAG: sensor histidine kinase [Saccharofermentanales bacterium]